MLYLNSLVVACDRTNTVFLTQYLILHRIKMRGKPHFTDVTSETPVEFSEGRALPRQLTGKWILEIAYIISCQKYITM